VGVLLYNLIMLDLKQLIQNFEETKAKLSSRGFDITQLNKIKELASQRSEVMNELQTLEAERNTLSKQIGQVKASGGDVEAIMTKVSEIKNKIDGIKDKEVSVNSEISSILLLVPNIPNDKTPVGKDEDENVLIKEHGDLGKGKITGVKPHYEVAVDLDIVDFERAVKLSGTRF